LTTKEINAACARALRGAAAVVQKSIESDISPHISEEYARGTETGLRAATMQLMLLASRMEDGTWPASLAVAAPTPSPDNCGRCRFWRKDLEDSFEARNYGKCHRHAPARGRFPLADRHAWCGEFDLVTP